MTIRKLIQYMLMSKDLDKPVLIRYKDEDLLNIEKASMTPRSIVITAKEMTEEMGE